MLYTFNYVLNYANFYINTLIKILELSLYVTRFSKRGLIHAQFQDTLFIAIC